MEDDDDRQLLVRTQVWRSMQDEVATGASGLHGEKVVSGLELERQTASRLVARRGRGRRLPVGAWSPVRARQQGMREDDDEQGAGQLPHIQTLT